MNPLQATSPFLVLLILCIKGTLQQGAVYNEDPNLLHPFVRAPAGNFLGKAALTRGGRFYNEFLGIPYAEAPKRFEPSVLAKPSTAIFYDARADKAICAQTVGGAVSGSEDCLFLSVSYPHVDRCQSEPSPSKLPVMVNIHGGGFTSGAGSQHSGKYLLDECVVYVSINYRLGAFGFLATEDGVLPGNLGLKDQVLALQWVQKNIGAFRGDPSKVTIFGISAGGSSVSHLVASPAAAGLIHRAIAQSGVVLNPWSITRDPNRNTNLVAKAMGCSTDSSTAIKECLLGKNMSDIISKQGTTGQFIPFTPVIESKSAKNPFQTRHPAEVLRSGDFNRIPLMAGFTQDEGIGIFAATILQNQQYVNQANSHWNQTAPQMFSYDQLPLTPSERDEVSTKIRKFYFNNQDLDQYKNRQNLTDLYSDRYFVQGTFDTVELHSKFAPAFPYVLSYKGGFSGAIGFGYMVPACTHADDAQYIYPSHNYLPGSEPYEFSLNMVALWTSFAKTGKPVGLAPTLDSWPQANTSKGNEVWFDLSIPSKTHSNYLDARRTFWKELGLEKYEQY